MIGTCYDVEQLRRSWARLRGWSAPSRISATLVTDGYQTCPLVIGGDYTEDGEQFRWVLDDFAPLFAVRATILNPGGVVLSHIDQGPYLERWQIPVETGGSFHVDDIPLEQIPGVPFRVAHWLPHRLAVPYNQNRRRVILIDRNITLDVPSGDYRVFA